MKSWFTKFKISSALDTGAPLSAQLRQKIARSGEVRDFAEDTRALDRALKTPLPGSPVPPALHASIMKAVRANSRSVPAQPRKAAFRWLPAPALAALALLLVGVWWTLNRSGTTPSPPHDAGPPAAAAAASAVSLGDQMTGALPSAVIAPMADELARVSQDLDSTAQFLLASLP